MDIAPAAARLSPAGQRVLASFLAGRLPAGQLHAELVRTETVAAGPPPVPAEASLVPLPAPPAQPALAIHVG